MQRLETKQTLRLISEWAIRVIIGNVPRKQRREAGRYYANEAYRMMWGRPFKEYVSPANKIVIGMIVKEYDRYTDAIEKSKNGTDTPPDAVPQVP